MYQWRITYRLKDNSFYMGMYEGPEKDSLSVMRKLFDGNDKDFISHYGTDKDHMIGVRIGEVVAFDICKWED